MNTKSMCRLSLSIVGMVSLGITIRLLPVSDEIAGAFENDAGNATSTTETARRILVDLGTGRLCGVDPDAAELVVIQRAPVAHRGERAFLAESESAGLVAMIDPWQPLVFICERAARRSGEPATVRRVAIDANPQALAFTPNGDRLLVACDPPRKADRPLCVVDLKSGAVARRLISGSNLRGIAIDPSGKFALAAHLVPKSDLPATQIEQGWVFTNAISYVPLDEARPIVTLPLDQRTRGYANPEGVAIAPDGMRAYVAHAGADIVSVLDLPALVAVAEDVARREPQKPGERTAEIRTAEAATGQGEKRSGAESTDGYRPEDLRLTRKYVRARIAVGANPRWIAVSKDSRFVAVVNRLDDSISVIDARSSSVVRTIALPSGGATPSDGKAREGEKLFHSGNLAFSGQFSCASCHPDGQVDGLNWDLPADGFNNFHNTKTLLGTSGTAPYGWLGTSRDVRERFGGTLRQLFQHEPTEDESDALEAYLARLDYPPDLPPRVASNSAAAKRGEALFHGAAQCVACHRGTKLTDREQHDVGTGSDATAAYDTPSLIRIAETAPYLHDGRAETLTDIFTRHNPAGSHGNAASLSPAQLADLVEYLRSL